MGLMTGSFFSPPTRFFFAAAPLAASLAIFACGGDGDDTTPTRAPTAPVGTSSPDAAVPDQPEATEGCSKLCTGGGFTGGKETDFKNGLVECLCSGTAGEVTESACKSYCATFDVSADKAFVTIEQSAKNDKCVCDGT